MGKFGEKTREARLRWYGHLRRKGEGYIGRRMPRMELPGKRKQGRLKRRYMGVVKEDMAEVEVTEEDTVDRNNWRRKIRCGDPWWEKAERRRRRSSHAFLTLMPRADWPVVRSLTYLQRQHALILRPWHQYLCCSVPQIDHWHNSEDLTIMPMVDLRNRTTDTGVTASHLEGLVTWCFGFAGTSLLYFLTSSRKPKHSLDELHEDFQMRYKVNYNWFTSNVYGIQYNIFSNVVIIVIVTRSWRQRRTCLREIWWERSSHSLSARWHSECSQRSQRLRR